MGQVCIDELDIAFVHASICQIRPPKEDSTYIMSGDGVVYCFSWKEYVKKVEPCSLYFSEL